MKQWNSSLPARKTPMKRTAIQRKQPWAKGGKRTAKLRPGKKTREWEEVRRKLKVEFQRAGIVTCEARYEGCMRDNGLTFAHSKRRRNVVGCEIEEVALACLNCHHEIDGHGSTHMHLVVRGIIAAREVPVRSIFPE